MNTLHDMQGAPGGVSCVYTSAIDRSKICRSVTLPLSSALQCKQTRNMGYAIGCSEYQVCIYLSC